MGCAPLLEAHAQAASPLGSTRPVPVSGLQRPGVASGPGGSASNTGAPGAAVASSSTASSSTARGPWTAQPKSGAMASPAPAVQGLRQGNRFSIPNTPVVQRAYLSPVLLCHPPNPILASYTNSHTTTTTTTRLSNL